MEHIYQKRVSVLLTLYFVLFTLGGFTLLIVGLVEMNTGAIFNSVVPRAILIPAIVIGAVIAFIDLIGIVSSRNKHRTTLTLVAYATTALILGEMILLIIITTRSNNLEGFLSDAWDSATSSQRLRIEVWGQCCGFNNPLDRVEEPCTKYADPTGCFAVIQDFTARSILSIKIAGGLLITAQALAVVAVFFVIKWLPSTLMKRQELRNMSSAMRPTQVATPSTGIGMSFDRSSSMPTPPMGRTPRPVQRRYDNVLQ